MKFSKDVQRRIFAALAARLPEKEIGACPICRVTKWELYGGFALIPASQDVPQEGAPGPRLPCAVLLCQQCGNTHFLNLSELGFDEVFLQYGEATPEPSEPLEGGPGLAWRRLLLEAAKKTKQSPPMTDPPIVKRREPPKE